MVAMLAEDASSIEGMEVDKSLHSALINKIPYVTNVKATLPFHNQQNTESGVGSSFSMLTKNHTHFEVENNEEHDFQIPLYHDIL